MIPSPAKLSRLVSTCRPFRNASMLVLSLALAVVAARPAQAQTFTVLHTFTGGQDGASPDSGLTLDRAGHLYGTTTLGANGHCLGGCGTVFRISSAGVLTTLYRFNGNDGDFPQANVTVASDGVLYGTTEFGGVYGAGNIYMLQPPAHAVDNATETWNETVLYTFGPIDNGLGVEPWFGSLIFDHAGNIYGTASAGGTGHCGTGGCGAVYKLTPSNGAWTYSVLYRFTCGTDGATPFSGVILDPAGRLYGTTDGNLGCDYGTIYQLVPAGLTWTEITLHQFQSQNDGSEPVGGLVMDAEGNLYGITGNGGSSGCGGVVYELIPQGNGWTFTPIYCPAGSPVGGSESAMTIDAAGNLYGTTVYGGAHRDGSVFKLTRNNGSWSYTDLYDFTGGADGGNPIGAVAVDANGNVYGTASDGGTSGKGVAWKITP